MQEAVEIRLHDNSKIVFSWTHAGCLSVELLRPMTLRDGHGYAVVGSTILGIEETQNLLRQLYRCYPKSLTDTLQQSI
jgi:hypothetical protein